MSSSVLSSDHQTWRSPTACEIADAVWSIHRAYHLMCSLASEEQSSQLRRRRLQCPEDRREEDRTTICLPVDLTPVLTQDDALIAVGPPISSVTRDLSPHGIGLRHDREVETRFAAAEFDVFGEPVIFLVEFRWTREEELHSFISGGRLVAVVDPARLVGRAHAPDRPAAGAH